jgi:hypothetical protein
MNCIAQKYILVYQGSARFPSVTREDIMGTRLPLIVGLSALGLEFAMMPANAGSSRVTNFLFTCDGTNKTINITASGFPANSNQFILAGEVTLFENRGGLQYIILRAEGNPQKQIVSLAFTENAARGPVGSGNGIFFPVTANAAGNIPLTLDGTCNGGFGQIQGNVAIYFN